VSIKLFVLFIGGKDLDLLNVKMLVLQELHLYKMFIEYASESFFMVYICNFFRAEFRHQIIKIISSSWMSFISSVHLDIRSNKLDFIIFNCWYICTYICKRRKIINPANSTPHFFSHKICGKKKFPQKKSRKFHTHYLKKCIYHLLLWNDTKK